MKTRLLILCFFIVVLATLGCGLIDSVVNKVAPSGNVAADLWSDVPRMEGMTKSDIEMPLPLRLIAQAASQGIMTEAGDSAGSMEFVAFTTDKSPTDVTAFYTVEQMQGAGWNVKDMPGCTSSQDVAQDEKAAVDVGAMCLFAREEGDKGTLLVLLAAQDEQSKQTQLFFTRIAGSISKLKGTAAPQ